MARSTRRRTTRRRNDPEPYSSPHRVIIPIAWLLGVIVTLFGYPGGVILLIGLLLARMTARKPRPSGANPWGVAAPANERERRDEASWRRADRFLTRDLLPTGPDACPPIAMAALACMTQEWWMWPFQFITVYLTMASLMADRRDMTLKPRSLDWGMVRRRVPWARKHVKAIIGWSVGGIVISLPLCVLTGRVEPMIILAALLAPIPMRPAIRQANKAFDLDMRAAGLVHRWTDSLTKPPMRGAPGRIHDTREGGDGSLLFRMDVTDANDWVRDPVMDAYQPAAQRDDMRIGFVLDGDSRAVVIVAITPVERPEDLITDRVELEARLTVDEMRAGFLYGALPGRIVHLKPVGSRNGRPAVWSFDVSGSNADWEGIGRDWLKGSTRGRYGDWGSLDGLTIIADIAADHGWVSEDEKWDTVDWDVDACRPLMADKPTARHDDPGRYLTLIREDAKQKLIWEAALGRNGPAVPSTIVWDSLTRLDSPDGWFLETTRILLPRGSGIDDYMTVDLRPAFGEAYVADVLPFRDRTGWHDRMMLFVHAPRKSTPQNTGMPVMLRDLKGDAEAHCTLARVIASRALARVLKRPARVGPAVQLAAAHAEWTMWRMPVELGEGVTAKDVQKSLERLKSAMGADRMLLQWADAGRVVIYAGVQPSDDPADYANRADRDRILRLELDDAWAQSGAKGADGRPPSTARIGREGALTRVEFTLPAGLGADGALRHLDAFKSTAGFGYARRRPSDSGLTLLLSRENPLPSSVMTDWTRIRDTRNGIPFAVGDDGRTVTFDPRDTAHLLISGMTMSGKSSAAVTLVCGMLLDGWQVMVADPVKHAGDFTRIRSKLSAVADGLNETNALFHWLTEENQRRLELQRANGVEDWHNLPDSIRPPRICLFADEFNSTLGAPPAKITNTDGDPDIDNRNLRNAWEGRLRSSIGMLAGDLLTQSRSQGITILLGAQKLNTSDLKSLPSTAKSQMGRLFIGGGEPAGNLSERNLTEANRLIRQAMTEGGMPKGRGLYERMGRGVQMVQCWYSGQGDQLAEALKDVPDAQQIDYDGFLEDPPRMVGVVDAGNEGNTVVESSSGEDGDVVVVDGLDWGEL